MKLAAVARWRLSVMVVRVSPTSFPGHYRRGVEYDPIGWRLNSMKPEILTRLAVTSMCRNAHRETYQGTCIANFTSINSWRNHSRFHSIEHTSTFCTSFRGSPHVNGLYSLPTSDFRPSTLQIYTIMSTKFLNGVLPFGSGKMAFWCLPGFLLCRLIMISMDPQNAMHWVWQDSKRRTTSSIP
jgi:hypothetical protein